MEKSGCQRSRATDESYNDGNSSGHMWNDKRTTQTQGNVVVERGGCGAVRYKKINYGKWKKENTEEARMEYKVDGSIPKWTRREVVEKNCQACKLNKEDAVDLSRWKKLIKDV